MLLCQGFEGQEASEDRGRREARERCGMTTLSHVWIAISRIWTAFSCRLTTGWRSGAWSMEHGAEGTAREDERWRVAGWGMTTFSLFWNVVPVQGARSRGHGAERREARASQQGMFNNDCREKMFGPGWG